MLSNIKIRALVVTTLLVLLGASLTLAIINSNRDGKMLLDGQGIPDRDIVFVVGNNTLGFINSDGSEYVTRTINLANWSPLDILGSYTPSHVDYVTWGANGRFLIARYSTNNPSAGIPMWISNNGDFSRCPNSKTAPYGFYRSWMLSDTALLTINNKPSGNKPDEVITVDLTSCQKVKTLYSSKNGSYEESIREATISSQGWLAISRWIRSQDSEEILIIASNDTLFRITGASFPTWSPDGGQLAYFVRLDFIHFIERNRQHPIAH